jgi:hypothetical protein
MSYVFTGTKLCVVLTFLIKSSTSAQGQAVELSGSLSLEVEHGRLRYRPLRGSGRSLKRSSARMGTDSPSPPKTTRRKAPLVLWSLSSEEEDNAEGRVLSAVHHEGAVAVQVLDLPGHVGCHD